MMFLEHNLHKHKRNSEFVGTVVKKERLNRLRDAWDRLRLEANRVENVLSSSDVRGCVCFSTFPNVFESSIHFHHSLTQLPSQLYYYLIGISF